MTKVRINIFSDSQAGGHQMFGFGIPGYKNSKSLNEMSEQFKIRLIWVPGDTY